MSAENVITETEGKQARDESRPLRIWTRVKFMFARGFLWGWARCFSLTGLYLFGQVFGTCEWLVNYKRRRRFYRNVAHVFGQPADKLDLPSIRGACLRHFTRTRCDKLFYLIFDKLPRDKMLKRIRFHGQDVLDEALRRNKGAYLCMSHMGSHYVGLLMMPVLGYPMAGVRDRNEGALRRYVQEKFEATLPESRAIRMFFADTYPRDLYRCFHQGRILASALDVARHRGSHLRTTSVKMFGQDREFLTGTMQIALRCGASVLQGFVLSQKNFYFHLIILGPLADPETATDNPATLNEIMQRYADNIADFVAKHPEHISKT